MPLSTIYIARHGFRANWIDSKITTSPTGMPRDPPLAAYGVEQAVNLSKYLAEQCDPVPELVFSSPFYRCIQTSLPTAQRLGKKIKLEHGVAEWYSTVPSTSQKLHPRSSPANVLAQYFPTDILDFDYSTTFYPSRKGEQLVELQERCKGFFDGWFERMSVEYPDVKTVVIFAHAASVIALGQALTGDPALEVIAGCCTCSTYTLRPSSSPQIGNWDISKNGEASFLEKGVERQWSFKDVVLTKEGDVIDDEGDTGTENEKNEPVGLVWKAPSKPAL